jgi:hypothetical protein
MSRITQRGATGPLAFQANGTFQTSTDTSLETLLGTRWDLADGREVALGQPATGTTVAPGKLYQNAALVANHQNLDVTAVQAYSNNGNVPAKVTVTLGNTAATANQYAGGYLAVVDGTGEGQILKIASHPAADASASLVVTLEDGPLTALSASDSEASLLPATGNGLVIAPTTLTNSIFGLSLYVVAAGSYGFFLTRGVGNALGDATAPAAGTPISPSTATAGAIGSQAYATNIVTTQCVGSASILAVSGEYRPVSINISG